METLVFATIFLGLVLCGNARFAKDSGCGVTKGCFSDCRSFDGCSYIITWVQTPTGVDFTIKGQLLTSDDQYIAFGLSGDTKMGKDSVNDCVMRSGTINVSNSWNPNGDNNVLTSNPTLGLSSMAGSYVDSILYCSFKRANTTTDPQIYSLITDWYMFWAIGSYRSSKKHEHDDYGISDRVIDLQSFDDVLEVKNPKVKAHGCLVIIAWIGFCSVGVVLSRYYKPMWVSKKLFGTALWFQFHRALMFAAVLINLIGVIVVFSGNFNIFGTKIQKGHPVIGIIVTVLSIINVIVGFIRPSPTHKYRPIFNWSHLSLGLASYLLGVLNIGIGVTIDKSSVPFEVLYVVIAFVIYQVCMEVVLEIIDRTGKQKKSQTGSFNPDTKMVALSDSKVNLNMLDSSNVSTQAPPAKESEPYCSSLKNILLVVHIAIISIFCISIIVVVAIF